MQVKIVCTMIDDLFKKVLWLSISHIGWPDSPSPLPHNVVVLFFLFTAACGQIASAYTSYDEQ